MTKCLATADGEEEASYFKTNEEDFAFIRF